MALALEAIRKDRGLTQKEVADMLGINLPKYMAWEGITKSDLDRIATVLKVDAKDIRLPR